MFPVHPDDLTITGSGDYALKFTIVNWLRRVSRERECLGTTEVTIFRLLQDAFTIGNFDNVFALRGAEADDALDAMLEVRLLLPDSSLLNQSDTRPARYRHPPSHPTIRRLAQFSSPSSVHYHAFLEGSPLASFYLDNTVIFINHSPKLPRKVWHMFVRAHWMGKNWLFVGSDLTPINCSLIVSKYVISFVMASLLNLKRSHPCRTCIEERLSGTHYHAIVLYYLSLVSSPKPTMHPLF